MSRGFNLSFKMFMEGVVVPFKSANIICTPNGVEASISIYANKFVYDLKPKTAVQIFYKDWTGGGKQGWRLMFDGFYSAITKEDGATDGRQVAITCRDFRADLRKAPAYLSYAGDESLGTINMYAMQGLYDPAIVKGSKLGSIKTVGNREYDQTLAPLSDIMRYIAGTAYNTGHNPVDNKPKVVSTNKKKTTATTTSSAPVGYVGASAVINDIVGSNYSEPPEIKDPGKVKSTYEGMSDSFQNDEEGKAKCGLFLDAFIRGLWTEAAGGTAIGVFTNRRTRMDKRFFIPSNRAGYNFWNRQAAGLELGSYMMSDSRFSSLEAAIMRCAGLFGTHVYSCNTPGLIPVSEKKAAHNPYSSDTYAADVFSKKPTINKIVDFIVDSSVRKNLIDNPNHEFGGKYILNESMLLPPFEFTAPPNCNIFLPPFCNRTVWQFDTDAAPTRGYYSITDSLSGYGGDQLAQLGVQVPNTLFDRSQERGSLYKGASVKDSTVLKRYKPPITLEERYKGITLTYGSVNQDIAMDEVVAEKRTNAGLDAKAEANRIKTGANSVTKKSKVGGFDSISSFSPISEAAKKSMVDATIKTLKAASDKDNRNGYAVNPTTNALRRHAVIKFLNEKYSGGMVTVDMMFNPYPMCGFPGMYVDDETAGGGQTAKTIVGMVQQVKHVIAISNSGAEASTTVLMTGVRFVEEPTDTDKDGNALYMGKTDRFAATIDINSLEYRDITYRVPEPTPITVRTLSSKAYDMAQINESKDVFAKDFLSVTRLAANAGRSNIYYLDREYDPQHIPLFYKKVLLHTENSFMIGKNVIDKSKGVGGDSYFVYDTMHEAVVDLRVARQELLYDYDSAMKFVSRNVCSADAFYQGILGLSLMKIGSDKKVWYDCNTEEFDDSRIMDEYFGVTTKVFNEAGFDKNSAIYDMVDSGLLNSDGEFSSILETTPLTAFIKERKAAVKNYIAEANKVGQGMRFTVPGE